MPQVIPAESRQTIEIDIADFVAGGTVIKRRARYRGFFEDISSNNESSLGINIWVTHYAVGEDGGYGARLTLGGLSDHPDVLHGRNDTLCDFRTDQPTLGQQLHQFNSWDTQADRQAIIDSYDFDTILQGDFFAWLRESSPVLIGAMLRQHIEKKFL